MSKNTKKYIMSYELHKISITIALLTRYYTNKTNKFKTLNVSTSFRIRRRNIQCYSTPGRNRFKLSPWHLKQTKIDEAE